MHLEYLVLLSEYMSGTRFGEMVGADEVGYTSGTQLDLQASSHEIRLLGSGCSKDASRKTALGDNVGGKNHVRKATDRRD